VTAPSLKTLKRWLINLLIFASVYWGIQAYQGRDTPSTGPAPAINSISLNGESIQLAALNQHPTLIYFWATWCNICALTKSAINNIAQDHPVITVVTQSGSDADIAKYLAEHKLSATVINDENGQLSQAYGVRAFPTIFIINSQGEINDVEIGLSSEWGLRLRLWAAD